jgi:cysteinyl-tRNA synthetase
LLTQSASIHKKISSKLQNYDDIEPAFHADSEVGKCLLDDLNTPFALSVFQEKIANDNQNIDQEVATYKYIFEGSNQDNSISVEDIKLIEQLIAKRNQARKNGNYEEADKIRDKLDKMKVSIKDINGKTEWTK